MKKEEKKFNQYSNCSRIIPVMCRCPGRSILMNSRPKTDFIPDASEESSEGSWSEPETKPAQASIPKTPESQEARFETGSPEDEIQVVASEGDEVLIDLTPPVTKPAAEAAPSTAKPVKKCPDKPALAEAAPETVTESVPGTAANSESAASPTAAPEPAPSEAPASESQPAADDHAGQVYDPVFGWLTPGNPQADVLDNDGDVNKQIGYIE